MQFIKIFSDIRRTALIAVQCLIILLSHHVNAQDQDERFSVTVFYSGTWDAAHISFVNESKTWFPAIAQQYNFDLTMTNDWSRLNDSYLAQQDVVLFLDDIPHSASQRTAFQKFMENGGGWMGFHVSAFNTDPASWDWYHNQFLGTGAFQSNTWGATSAILRVENHTHPATKNLPDIFTSAVSEWYSWSRNLRNNPDITVLASIDQSSFPVGTDPNQTWYSGDYPIVWTNNRYRMIYANMGHNDMNYSTNTPLSSTFSSETQNKLFIDALLWLGGRSEGSAPEFALPATFCATDYAGQQGIQTEATTLAGCSNNVGWIDSGDWLQYNIDVPQAGYYTLNIAAASQDGGGQLQLDDGGPNAYAVLDIPATGGWQAWTTVNTEVYLNQGKQDFRALATSGGFNLHSFAFSSTEIGQTIQAEDYSYMNGVQTEATTDTGGGLDVGYLDAGDWLSYDAISVPVSGDYVISYRVASLNGGGRLQLERAGGSPIYGTVDIPATDGWQAWTTVSHTIHLEAGQQGFGIKVLAGGFNINWWSITPAP